MDAYFTLTDGSSELVVSRSKFLGFVKGIETEEDALDFLAGLKKSHPDATHICYAYIADTGGTHTRFSDAGEPAGTAGIPILNVLRGGGYKKTAAAVVRYFGGTKLGTGGLSKAYADTVKLAAAAAVTLKMVYCDIYRVALSFADYKKAEKILKDPRFKMIKTEFTDGVRLTVAVQKDPDPAFLARMTEISLGKAKIEPAGQRYENF